MSKLDVNHPFWDIPVVQAQKSDLSDPSSTGQFYGKLLTDLTEEQDTFTQVYEITLNVNENIDLPSHITLYKTVWAQVLKAYKCVKNLYYIEYCKSGQPHLHGYIEIEYHVNSLKYDDEHFIRDLARTIFLSLPKRLWKQFKNKFVINNHLRRGKSAALCLNMKNFIHTNWDRYIKKNAPQNII